MANILVVEPEPTDRNLMRTMLKGLGYPGIAESPNHLASLDKFEGRKFTHIIFDAKKGELPNEGVVLPNHGDCTPHHRDPRVVKPIS